MERYEKKLCLSVFFCYEIERLNENKNKIKDMEWEMNDRYFNSQIWMKYWIFFLNEFVAYWFDILSSNDKRIFIDSPRDEKSISFA